MDLVKTAKLANLPITEEESITLNNTLQESIEVLDKIKTINVSDLKATSQVTGLENVTRIDKIDSSRCLTQDEALSMAKDVQNGYFKVPSIFED